MRKASPRSGRLNTLLNADWGRRTTGKEGRKREAKMAGRGENLIKDLVELP